MEELLKTNITEFPHLADLRRRVADDKERLNQSLARGQDVYERFRMLAESLEEGRFVQKQGFTSELLDAGVAHIAGFGEEHPSKVVVLLDEQSRLVIFESGGAIIETDDADRVLPMEITPELQNDLERVADYLSEYGFVPAPSA